MTTIIITNNKGGTGKTTTAVALAYQLSLLQHGRVLLVDLDEQGNATETAGGTMDVQAGAGSFLIDPNPTAKSFRQTYTQAVDENIDLLPATEWLDEQQATLRAQKGFETRLRERLALLRGLYSYVVVDCPPALNEMNYVAFLAADWYMVVAKPSSLALRGVQRVMEIAQSVQLKENHNLKCLGILFTHFHPNERGRVRQEVVSVTLEDFGPELRLPSIRQDIAVEEAQTVHQPLQRYAPKSRASQDYVQLTLVVLKRMGHNNAHSLVPADSSY